MLLWRVLPQSRCQIRLILIKPPKHLLCRLFVGQDVECWLLLNCCSGRKVFNLDVCLAVDFELLALKQSLVDKSLADAAGGRNNVCLAVKHVAGIFLSLEHVLVQLPALDMVILQQESVLHFCHLLLDSKLVGGLNQLIERL